MTLTLVNLSLMLNARSLARFCVCLSSEEIDYLFQLLLIVRSLAREQILDSDFGVLSSSQANNNGSLLNNNTQHKHNNNIQLISI